MVLGYSSNDDLSECSTIISTSEISAATFSPSPRRQNKITLRKLFLSESGACTTSGKTRLTASASLLELIDPRASFRPPLASLSPTREELPQLALSDEADTPPSMPRRGRGVQRQDCSDESELVALREQVKRVLRCGPHSDNEEDDESTVEGPQELFMARSPFLSAPVGEQGDKDRPPSLPTSSSHRRAGRRSDLRRGGRRPLRLEQQEQEDQEGQRLPHICGPRCQNCMLEKGFDRWAPMESRSESYALSVSSAHQPIRRRRFKRHNSTGHLSSTDDDEDEEETLDDFSTDDDTSDFEC